MAMSELTIACLLVRLKADTTTFVGADLKVGPYVSPADSKDTSAGRPTYCSARLVIAARELVR